MPIENTKDTLKEGVYHEIGHVIATFLCFPNEDRVRSISLERSSANYCGVSTMYDYLGVKDETQFDPFVITALAGGVFQQMKAIQRSFSTRVISYLIGNRLLLKYYQLNVKEMIPGMEIDYKLIEAAKKLLLCKWGVNKADISFKKAKDNCVLLLFPYIESPEIDNLCKYCVDLFWEEGHKASRVDVDIETIKKYLERLDLNTTS